MIYPFCSAKIERDSICGDSRLTTFVVTCPRFMWSEVLTHSMLVRNAQSSRAIPVAKRIERVRASPVMPIKWQLNQPGMVAKDEPLSAEALAKAKQEWLNGATNACNTAQALLDQGLAKQWANRVLEPYDTITAIISGTEWANFFALRTAANAQPEFQDLAKKMAVLYYFKSTPTKLMRYELHLPFITDDDWVYAETSEAQALVSDSPLADPVEAVVAAISVGRVARVSYLTHDGKRDPSKDIQLHNMLVSDKHMSPFAHIAYAKQGERGSQFKDWLQYRKLIVGENITTFSCDKDQFELDLESAYEP